MWFHKFVQCCLRCQAGSSCRVEDSAKRTFKLKYFIWNSYGRKKKCLSNNCSWIFCDLYLNLFYIMHSISCVMSSALPYVLSSRSIFLPCSAKGKNLFFRQCWVAPNSHTLDFLSPVAQGGTRYILEAGLLPDLWALVIAVDPTLEWNWKHLCSRFLSIYHKSWFLWGVGALLSVRAY